MERGACLGIDPVTVTCEASLRGEAARRSAGGPVRTVLGLALLFHFSTVWAESSEPSERFCRSDGKAVSPWLAANPTIRLPEDVSSVGGLVEHLRAKHSIPISWIPVQAEEPLKVEPEASPLDDLLRSVADQHPEYRCEVRSGRLILRSGAEIFDRLIEDVDIADRFRFPALKDYIEHLRTIGGGFESWISPLVGGNLGSPLLAERISLVPRAPILTHLVQLLGKRLNTYFTITVPGEVPRTIYISETP